MPTLIGMDSLSWAQTVSAVLAANALTLWFVHSAWTVTKIERSGGKPSSAPWTALIGLLVPCIILGVGAYLLSEV